MDIKKIRQKAFELFEKMSHFKDFQSFIEEDIFTGDFIHELYDNDIYYNSGCTRYVFWDKNDLDCDYVYKINFRNEPDYCKKEAENYKKACEYGIEKMFAECAYVLTYEGRDIYAMEFADVDDDQACSDLREKMETVSHLSEEEIDDIMYDSDECDVVSELLNYYYDSNTLISFNELCYHNQINDIHDNNVGYINDRLVMIDYAGYGVLE